MHMSQILRTAKATSRFLDLDRDNLREPKLDCISSFLFQPYPDRYFGPMPME